MLPSQRKILDTLQKHDSLTMSELHFLTGYTTDSIRGRISEIRKLRYKITNLDGKYRLDKDRLAAEKLLSYIESHNLYGIKIKINRLMNELDISHEDLTNILSKLYHRKQLFQLTKDVVIIYHI